MEKVKFLQLLKKALEDKLLEYTTITRRYYLTVPGFGGVTLACTRRTESLENEKGFIYVHDLVFIQPYADTGLMDELSMSLPIPVKESKEYYAKWGKESDEWLDDPKNNLVPKEGSLEELISTLSLFAINHHLQENPCTSPETG